MLLKDEQWPVARLIPISSASGIEAQERRAASALLAVMHAVPEFGRSLIKPLGAPAGAIDTFIEVPFKLGDRSIRPDGVISVTRGSRSWRALVEVKTAAGALNAEQIEIYLDLARELEFEAVISISNQYVTSSTEYPIEIDRRKTRRVSLHHWSWIDVLTEAIIDHDYRGLSDPDQAYILQELIRYLSDSRSGAVSFEGMGPHWTTVRDGAREQTLRRGDAAVTAVAARWDDLIRYLALSLTKDLGRSVRQTLAPAERTPAMRRAALTSSLANTGQLYADLQIPDAAGPLQIMADVRARQVSVSTQLDAPADGRSKGRISWLLRQLQEAPEALKIEVKTTRSQTTLAASLSGARGDPQILYPEQPREVRRFMLTLSRNMGLKRDGSRGSFAESVLTTTEDFYRGVLQGLRPWKPQPPKLKKPAPEDIVEDVSELLDIPTGEVDESAIAESSGLVSDSFLPRTSEPSDV
jgi:hypothetical protein